MGAESRPGRWGKGVFFCITRFSDVIQIHGAQKKILVDTCRMQILGKKKLLTTEVIGIRFTCGEKISFTIRDFHLLLYGSVRVGINGRLCSLKKWVIFFEPVTQSISTPEKEL